LSDYSILNKSEKSLITKDKQANLLQLISDWNEEQKKVKN